MIITRSFIPNLFTLTNLFSGFAAIIYAANENFYAAAGFILLAAVFDALDGTVARALSAASELGAELDSLCDVVSFGVAPAVLLYKVYFYQLGDLGMLLSSLPALGGALRLARFNAELESLEDKSYFTGLPIPSAALTIVSFVVFYFLPKGTSEAFKIYGVYSLSVAVPFAMVSRIKFDNIPRFTKRSFKQKPIVSILFAIGLILSIATKGEFVFPFMAFYIVGSAVRHFIVWLKETREAPDDFDESEDFDQSKFNL